MLFNSFQLLNFRTSFAKKLGFGWIGKVLAGTWQTQRTYLVWKIE